MRCSWAASHAPPTALHGRRPGTLVRLLASGPTKTKTPVFGMVERGGKVAAHVVPSIQGPTLGAHVEARVLPEAVIYTDEAPAYVGIAQKAGYEHRRIHHTARVYVDGNVHTNTIEGFWSLVKNGIRGSHHAVSAKHLQGT
jgi:hypothetical protein